MSLFNSCNHEWVLVSEKTLPSPWEQMTKRAKSMSSKEGGSIPHWFFEKKYILVQKCIKCGKIDKTTRTNP